MSKNVILSEAKNLLSEQVIAKIKESGRIKEILHYAFAAFRMTNSA